MRHKKLKISVILVLGLGLTELLAQESVNSTGGNATGSGGSASYSLGQLVYTTNTGTKGSVAQGIQQPYEIIVIASIAEAKGTSLECSVYPNPAADHIILKIVNYQIIKLAYQLFDINGKIIGNKTIESDETTIDLKYYASSVYFLKITENSKEVKIFKIIKN